MKKIKLSTQIALSLLAAAIFVGIAIGEVERYFETKRLNAGLQEQADLTVTLIGGLLIEALLVRDIPVIYTALEQAVNLSPKLLAITVFDGDGDKMSNYTEITDASLKNTRTYTKDIVYEGEKFGSMDIIWSTVQGQKMIAQNVNLARIKTFTTLTIISALFLALVSRLAMRPLHIVHERMTHTMHRDAVKNYRLPKFASIEF